jgi:Flp pilus assembly protein TadD
VALGVQGKTADAIQFFTRAAEAEPGNADAWMNLAIAWYNAGNAEEAKKYELKALEIDPEVKEKRGR